MYFPTQENLETDINPDKEKHKMRVKYFELNEKVITEEDRIEINKFIENNIPSIDDPRIYTFLGDDCDEFEKYIKLLSKTYYFSGYPSIKMLDNDKFKNNIDKQKILFRTNGYKIELRLVDYCPYDYLMFTNFMRISHDEITPRDILGFIYVSSGYKYKNDFLKKLSAIVLNLDFEVSKKFIETLQFTKRSFYVDFNRRLFCLDGERPRFM